LGGGAGSANYTIFGGYISGLADQTGELRFTGNGLLESMSFSSQPIPEPGRERNEALTSIMDFGVINSAFGWKFLCTL